MANLGTRKFYKSFDKTADAATHQVLKNTGYISVVLHSVFYNSKGSFWQNRFGGTDEVVLTTSITYQNGEKTIEAKSIQDKRTVRSGRNHTLGLSRLVALKVPANADGLELKVGLTAIKKDNFENAIGLMNSKEFQEPLQLSAVPIGQILAITKVVKKIFTGIEQNNHLEATFAGIISRDKVENPIQQERLCNGYLIMISNNDEDNNFLASLDEKKLQVEGDGLKYEGKKVEHTNIIYTITFEKFRGPDEDANWFKLYQDALDKLDDLLFAAVEDDKKKILDSSRKLWVEASALLYDDPTYLSQEKKSIKASFFKKINERYNELSEGNKLEEMVNTFIQDEETLDFIPEVKKYDPSKIIEESRKVSEKYMKELGKQNLVFLEK